MKIRWFAAGIAALLITGGAATVAQRVITQKTRGVLPEKNDSSHGDSRLAVADPAVPNVALGGMTPPPPQVAWNGEPPMSGQPVPDPPVVAADPVAPTESTDAPVPPTQPVEATMALVAAAAPADPAGPTLPPEAAPSDPAINLAAERGTPSGSVAAGKDAVGADPVDSVEHFVERNRKEAEAAIEALTLESENLKVRLAKVETALTRWQSFSRALNADQPPAQTTEIVPTKPNWKRGSAEATRPPATSTLPAPSAEPEPILVPGGPSAGVPSNPPVPIPQEGPGAAPTEPKPTEPPPAEPADLPGTSPT